MSSLSECKTNLKQWRDYHWRCMLKYRLDDEMSSNVHKYYSRLYDRALEILEDCTHFDKSPDQVIGYEKYSYGEWTE